MSKRAEDLAKQLYPDPKLENYDDILVYRTDRDNALMGRANVICVYEQAKKDLGWHSVDESLPPVDEEVIVLRNYWTEESVDPLHKISFGHIVDKNIAIDYDGWNVPSVKYWMPMPKLPKEDEK